MKYYMILLLLFLFLPVKVKALDETKTIITPYFQVGEVTSTYKPNSLEKIDIKTIYKQEKITKDYKYLETSKEDFIIKSNELKYGKFSNYQKKRINDKSLDEEIKTIYYYQDLKKINYLSIKNINNLLITKITLKYKDNIIYQNNTSKKIYNIKLSKYYSPEYLILDVTCFLNQEILKGSFTINNSNYINNKVIVSEKGYNKLSLKVINMLDKIMYEDNILKTTNLDNKFYINIITKENYYRYRKKYYKYYKNDIIIDTKINPLYKVIEVINKYYLYRKEVLELYDNIKLDNYLDLDKIIKRSTIPLSKLEFNYINNCSKTLLTIKYQNIEIAKVNITFNCKNITKAKVKRGKTKSFRKELFALIFKTLFLRNL